MELSNNQKHKFSAWLHRLLHAFSTYIIPLGAESSIILMRTEPSDSRQFPCPQQRVEFQCQITVPTTTLTWTISTGVLLEFSALRNVGDVRNSSDNVYSATLTEKAEDDDANSDRFFFISSLLVLQPVNGSTMTCTGRNVGSESTTITLSGK